MLEQLKADLEKFQSPEKADLTEKETETLREMFKVPDSFKVLFKYFCTIETDKGTQIAYDIERLPTTSDNFSEKEVAEEVKFKKMLVSFARMKMEGLRNGFASEASEKLSEAEKKAGEEAEKIKKEQEQRDLEAKGVSPDL